MQCTHWKSHRKKIILLNLRKDKGREVRRRIRVSPLEGVPTGKSPEGSEVRAVIARFFLCRFKSENLDIEVEYQSDTIGKYGLEFTDGKFQLSPTLTDCLAKDKCGIPEKPKTVLNPSSCDSTSGCC